MGKLAISGWALTYLLAFSAKKVLQTVSFLILTNKAFQPANR